MKTAEEIKGAPERFGTLIAMAQSIVRTVYQSNATAMFGDKAETSKLTKKIAEFRKLAKEKKINFDSLSNKELYEVIRKIGL